MKKCVLFIAVSLISVIASANVQCALTKIVNGRVTKTSQIVKISPNTDFGTIDFKITDLEASEQVGGSIIGYNENDLQISLYHTSVDVAATAANKVPVGVELSVNGNRYQLNCW